LDKYVGEYQDQHDGWLLTIEADGDELRLVFPGGVVRHAMLYHFKEIEWKANLEFTVSAGTVTQLTRQFESSPPQRLMKTH
jgi:hypothetical protein